MVLNSALPVMTVDPQTFKVTADGVHLVCEPAKKLPLTNRLFGLF
jgi:urease subunit alpha